MLNYYRIIYEINAIYQDHHLERKLKSNKGDKWNNIVIYFKKKRQLMHSLFSPLKSQKSKRD